MGLKNSVLIASAVAMLMASGCAGNRASVTPVEKRHKYWFECCDPGIPAAQKDMCKWLVERKTNTLVDGAGNLYVAIWTGCEEGKEPWRKYE